MTAACSSTSQVGVLTARVKPMPETNSRTVGSGTHRSYRSSAQSIAPAASARSSAVRLARRSEFGAPTIRHDRNSSSRPL